MHDAFPLYSNLHVQCRHCSKIAVAFILDSTHPLARGANFFLCEHHLSEMLNSDTTLRERFIHLLQDWKQRALRHKMEKATRDSEPPDH